MSKTAIVTGASRGIGRATAEALAMKGCRVIAVARSEKPLAALEQEFEDSIDSFACDLTKASQLEKLVDYIKENYRKIDILINNAGALINKPFEKLLRADWLYLFEANVLTAVELTKSVLTLLSENSHIVNISSMGGFQGSKKFAGLSAYSSMKGAVSILSEALAAEFAEQKIKVNALCIGSVQTAMFEKAFPGFEANVSSRQMGDYIADFALNGSTFYNGKVLPVALEA